MSWKKNQADPGRRARLMRRRVSGLYRRASTYVDLQFSLYVPGNGPNHRLGREECEDRLDRLRSKNEGMV